MIVTLMMIAQVAATAAPPTDSLLRVTLEQAIARATRLDPNYVRALGQVDNAEWGRRAAISTFVLPSITLSLNATKYSTDQFNIGTSRPQDVSVIADADGSIRALLRPKVRRPRPDLGGARSGAGDRVAAALPDCAPDRSRLLRGAAQSGARPGGARAGAPRRGGIDNRAGAGDLRRGRAERLPAVCPGADPGTTSTSSSAMRG